MEKEKKAIELQDTLDHCTPLERAKYTALQAVPCLLHLERRVGLKQLDLVLTDGCNNDIRFQLSDSNENANPEAEKIQYCERVARVVNTQIFGTQQCESHWKVPEDITGKLQPVSLENELVRRIVNKLEVIIDISYPDDVWTMWIHQIQQKQNGKGASCLTEKL